MGIAQRFLLRWVLSQGAGFTGKRELWECWQHWFDSALEFCFPGFPNLLQEWVKKVVCCSTSPV